MEQFIAEVHRVFSREDIEDLVQAPSFLTEGLLAIREALEPTYHYVHAGSWQPLTDGVDARLAPYTHTCVKCRSEDLVVNIRTEVWGYTSTYHLRPSDRWQHLQGYAVWIRRSDDGSGILVRIKN